MTGSAPPGPVSPAVMREVLGHFVSGIVVVTAQGDDGQPRTLDQIGRRFGLSRERVRQIEREVMAKLRLGERADRLRAYAS